MKVLLAPTEDYIKRDRTALTAAAAAGSNVAISVVSKENIAVGDYIVVGQEGTYTAELCQVSAVTETTITVGTLLNAHSVDEPIVKYRFNQRRFYGSITGGSGTFVELTAYGSPVSINVSDPQGTILEYSGGEGYLYFLATYWNSTTLDQTAITDATPEQANESVRYCSLYDIRRQAGLTQNAFVDDGRIEAKRKQAENECNSFLLSRYALPLANSQNLPEIPFLITRCCYLLAGGYLDFEEYGPDGEGVKWLGEARGILGKIQKGTQRLIDLSGAEFQTQSKTMVIRTGRGGPLYFRKGMKF